jgi:hypothetical protein
MASSFCIARLKEVAVAFIQLFKIRFIAINDGEFRCNYHRPLLCLRDTHWQRIAKLNPVRLHPRRWTKQLCMEIEAGEEDAGKVDGTEELAS